MAVDTPKIALIGARGIPTSYGGCETFAEELSQRLTLMGFEIYVTCNSRKYYTDKYNNVIRIHTPSIEGKTLTVPTINEVFHTFHLLTKYPKVNVIYYMLSYGALVAIVPKLLGKKIIICTDGIEWKRPLIRQPYFSPGWKLVALLTSWHLRLMEWMSVKVANIVIADSRAIKAYLEDKYKATNVVYISYGARELLNSDVTSREEDEILHSCGFSAGEYYLTVARIVAENNIHLGIEGFKRSKSKKKLVIVGNFNQNDGYTQHLIELKERNPNIVFLDSIYDKVKLGVLRKNCFGYIHAYQSGGTNPSLLEQMVFKKPIMAFDIDFHRDVLQGGGIFFRDDAGLASAIDMLEEGNIDLKEMGGWQTRRIEEEYNWDYVATKYASTFRALLDRKS
jgi:glycosyltransferase involved in cell wall biosynthesis